MSLTARSVTAFTSSTCRWDLFYNSSFIISCWEFYVKSGMKLPANDKSKKKKVSLFHFCFVPSLCLFCAWLYCGLPAGRRVPKLAVSKAAEYQKVSCQSNCNQLQHQTGLMAYSTSANLHKPNTLLPPDAAL